MNQLQTGNLVEKIPMFVGTLEQILLRLYAVLDGDEMFPCLADFVHVATFVSHETGALPDVQILEPVSSEQLERKLIGTWRFDHSKLVVSLCDEALTCDFTDEDGNILSMIG